MAKGMKDFVAKAKARIGTVSPGEADDAVRAGRAVLLDVREAAELTENGALGRDHLHIPRGVLEAKADPESGAANDRLTAARPDCAVLVVCASGARAAMAADRLRKMGYDAHVVEGGLKAWREAGLPVETKR